MSAHPRLQIGPYHVLGFHGLTDAPAARAALAQQHRAAAVVDHQYLLSTLHLAMAVHRLVSGAADAAEKKAPSLELQLYMALAATRNLDRVRHVLSPTADTTAVVVLWRESDDRCSTAAEALAAVARIVGEKGGGTEHSLLPPPGGRPAGADQTPAERLGPFAPYVDTERVLAFYGVPRAEYDERREQTAAVGAAAAGLPSALLPLLALERCVMNRIAAALC